MSPLTIVLFFATILCLFCKASSKGNYSTFCKDVETPLDFESVVGTWHLVATIEPKQNQNDIVSFNCMTVEFNGVLRKNSRDFILTGKTVETMFLKDVQGKEGVNSSSGCYQGVESLDSDIVHLNNSSQDKNIMLIQFYFIKTSERFLVLNIWHSVVPIRVALVFSKAQEYDGSEEDLKPILNFITGLSGEEQELEFCLEDNHANKNSFFPIIDQLK